MKKIKKTKESKYQNTTVKNPQPKSEWEKRVIIFTPTTGTIRMEWAQCRYGQIIPTNWSNVEMKQWLNSYVPIEYQLADAQNLMAKQVVEKDFEWLLSIEHDNIIPPDTFVRMNEYMLDGSIPVVSGLYFVKSRPPEPILYRGRGNSYFDDWKLGDKVWVDGVPFGLTLIPCSLIKEAWKESPEYMVGNITTRRVFERAQAYWFDQEAGVMLSKQGTTDLNWCTRLIDDKILEKAGFPKIQKMKYPFLVDTNMFVKHIDMNGVISPDGYGGLPKRFQPPVGYKGREIKD